MTDPKKIIFWPSSHQESTPPPVPARINVPKWYKEISMFNASNSYKDARVLNSGTGIDGSALSLKTCGPFYDAFVSGYHYIMPEDVTVKLNEKGIPTFAWQSNNFIINRLPNIELPIPPFHHPIAYSFRMAYGVKLPPGYSLLVTPPMNRYDLPYTVPFGIVDADTKFAPIDIRFFLKRDFEGVIRKGTPLFQVMPFKRDSWEMEVNQEITFDEMWFHELRRTYLHNWYGREAQVRKDFN